MNDIYEEDYEKEPIKNNNNTLLIIIIILLVLIIAGILVYFLLFRDTKEDNNKQTTTTTELITMPADIKMPKDLEEYKSLIDSATDNSTKKDGLILLDNTFKEFTEPLCDKEGKKEETVDGHKVSVSCSKMAEDFVDYNGMYFVDDKFKFEIKGNRSCGADYLYIGDNYIINYDPSCYMGGENMTIYNANGGESYKAGKEAPFIKTFDKPVFDDNNRIYKPVIKNNYLYFIGAQNKGDDNYKSTCNIYRLDLNNKSLSFVTSQPFDCEFGTFE